MNCDLECCMESVTRQAVYTPLYVYSSVRTHYEPLRQRRPAILDVRPYQQVGAL